MCSICKEREQKISEVKSNLELVEEALKIIKNSETNESLDSGNYFLTPWIIGGSATVLAVGLLGVIIIKKFQKGKEE